MNVGIRVRLETTSPALAADLARLDELWTDGLSRFKGPFLAGPEFTAVDAFFAPVAFRVQTYGLKLSPAAQEYSARLLALPSMKQWTDEALRETGREPGHEDEAKRAGTWLQDLRAKPVAGARLMDPRVIAAIASAAAFPLAVTRLRSAVKPDAHLDAATGAKVVRYGFGWRLLVAAYFALAVGLGALTVVRPPEGAERIPVALAVAVPFGIAALLGHEVFRRRYELTPTGIVASFPWAPWRARKPFAWSSLTGAAQTIFTRELVLAFEDGERLRLSPFLDGLEDLRRAAPAVVRSSR